MTISRLQKVPLRELWKHEAHGFTHWLAENLDFLGEALGFELTLVEREATAGPFSADIRAEDADGNYVIVENQLEQTDHDHLGKLITYLSNLEAKKAIWITSAPRPEHENTQQRPGVGLRIPHTGSPSGGDDRASQVPGEPQCLQAPFFDPGEILA